MQSETISEEFPHNQNNFIQNLDDIRSNLTGKNPLLLLARTCQNIGTERISSDYPQGDNPSPSIISPESSRHQSVSNIMESDHQCAEISTQTLSEISSKSRSIIDSSIDNLPEIQARNLDLLSRRQSQILLDPNDSKFKLYSNSLVELAHFASNLDLSPDRNKRIKLFHDIKSASNTKQKRKKSRRTIRRSNPIVPIEVCKPIDYSIRSKSKDVLPSEDSPMALTSKAYDLFENSANSADICSFTSMIRHMNNRIKSSTSMKHFIDVTAANADLAARYLGYSLTTLLQLAVQSNIILDDIHNSFLFMEYFAKYDGNFKIFDEIRRKY